MPFLEVFNGTKFEFYQINGTKYYKYFNPIPDKLRDQLEQCAGEIFLSKIPENITADQIATISSILGEMYILRFKVNFAGLSRGFAYLQYMNPCLMDCAMEYLPHLFYRYGFGNIQVRQSKNTSNLVVRNITDVPPEEVPTTLAKMCKYRECNLRYLKGYRRMEFQLVFGSNEDAVKARRFLIGNICIFGPFATVGWDIYAN